VPKVFSRGTLGKFEDASAGIPLRRLDRAFAGAEIRMGEDPGGPQGSRRTQFRRYVAGVDQRKPQQLERLGDALGALIAEVAASKVDFLVKAAQSDGFVFADGVFRPAGTAAGSFGVTRPEELASLDDRAKRLQLLAITRPRDAIAGAKELVASVCATVLRLLDGPASQTAADVAGIAEATLAALEPASARSDNAIADATAGGDLIRGCLQHLSAVVASLSERGLSTRHAQLAVGAAVTLAGFVAETYLEPGGRDTLDGSHEPPNSPRFRG
jgi:hypothetical protein